MAALEVNVSCPNVKEGGVLFRARPGTRSSGYGSQPCRAARAQARDDQLSPNVTDIALMARSVEDAGADSISCINTLLGMGVDRSLHSLKPLWPMLWAGFPAWRHQACGPALRVAGGQGQ